MGPLLCMAHGRDGDWEAICLDLDLAAQGRSFEEVQGALDEAIQTYIKDALAEPPAARGALLKRKAPFLVRLGYLTSFFWSVLRASRENEARHGYTVPCAA